MKIVVKGMFYIGVEAVNLLLEYTTISRIQNQNQIITYFADGVATTNEYMTTPFLLNTCTAA